MWLIIISGLCLIATYGGMPESWGVWLRPVSIAGIIIPIIASFITWRQDKKKKQAEKPRLEDYHYNHFKYRQALRKWEMTQDPALTSLSLHQRLERRGHCRSRGYYGDNLHYPICFVCGKSMGDNEEHCTECYSLYQCSPKKPLPYGIPETYRYRFWEYEQAIIVDVQKHLISEKQASYELDEVAGQVRADIVELERARTQPTKMYPAQERKLQERQALAERLLTK